jgi:rhamnulose-1-phosphate aldolase/alcohol dehydrogenase
MSGGAAIRSSWDSRAARGLSGPDLCAYASRLIGSDPRLVLWGGGNSSVKTIERDHAGRDVRAVWVKASGYDMKTLTPRGLTALRLDELLLLRGRREMSDEEMLAYVHRCQLDPKAARPSIETLLHAFLPFDHVLHTHADAVAGFSCTPGSERRTREAFGGKVLWVPYVRPGFQLAQWVLSAIEREPGARAMILDKHGALTWGHDGANAYEEMVRLSDSCLQWQAKAARRRPARKPLSRVSLDAARRQAVQLLPWIRGTVSRERRQIVLWDGSPDVLRFLERRDAEALSQKGPFSPDHTLHVKARPLFWRASRRGGLARAMEGYRRWYEGYFSHHAPEGTPPMDPYPRVVLVPGAGLFTTGRDARQAGAARDIYRHTIEVLERVSAFAQYTPLDLRHLGDIEFWPLETDKLSLLPPEKEFSRRIVFITGAAGAIGAETARAFAAAGAHLLLGDLDKQKLDRICTDLNTRYGAGCAVAVHLDVTDERSVDAAFTACTLAFGGVDVVFSNAGIAKAGAISALDVEDWQRSFEVNAKGHFLIFRAAMRLFKEQGIGGAVVLNGTKNVLAPGKEFGAYSASKAASVQLARVLALEGGQDGVRVNVVNPDAVFEGSGLWSPAVRRERAKAQGIEPGEIEDFYARRNILQARVTAADCAAAVLFLASERALKTTGALLPIDGGLREAFPR